MLRRIGRNVLLGVVAIVALPVVLIGGCYGIFKLDRMLETPEEQQTREVVELVSDALRSDIELRGRVVDLAGRGVEGAWIDASVRGGGLGVRAETDDDGYFALRSRSWSVVIRSIEREGYVEAPVLGERRFKSGWAEGENDDEVRRFRIRRLGKPGVGFRSAANVPLDLAGTPVRWNVYKEAVAAGGDPADSPFATTYTWLTLAAREDAETGELIVEVAVPEGESGGVTDWLPPGFTAPADGYAPMRELRLAMPAALEDVPRMSQQSRHSFFAKLVAGTVYARFELTPLRFSDAPDVVRLSGQWLWNPTGGQGLETSRALEQRFSEAKMAGAMSSWSSWWNEGRFAFQDVF